MTAPAIPPPTIVRAANDLLFDDQGRRYIDLFSANGTAWLGHCNPSIQRALTTQLTEVWNTGALDSVARCRARECIETFAGSNYKLAGFGSTGMEAAEFALRIARVATGRPTVVGFAQSMHGKSLATAALAWPNPIADPIQHFIRLPFAGRNSEHESLAAVHDTIRKRNVSALFVEPLQMSGGGFYGSRDYYQRIHELCVDSGTMLVFDEIITGLHRTGPPFFFSNLGFLPDIVLLGKGLGNGFPVSAVLVSRKYSIEATMLPGSTYAGNALASAAVAATIDLMRTLDLPRLVTHIECTIRDTLTPLTERGLGLRGRGAAWVLELPTALDPHSVVSAVYERGVVLGYAGHYIRLLPPATISPAYLSLACGLLADELSKYVQGGTRRDD